MTISRRRKTKIENVLYFNAAAANENVAAAAFSLFISEENQHTDRGKFFSL